MHTHFFKLFGAVHRCAILKGHKCEKILKTLKLPCGNCNKIKHNCDEGPQKLNYSVMQYFKQLDYGWADFKNFSDHVLQAS